MSKSYPESFEKICGSLKNRINAKNKSVMMLIVGEMGSGKSLAAVAIACQIDPSFVKHPRIVFSVREFLETLRKLKKGEAIIFDEAGVGVPAREWQNIQNKIMSVLAQILRYKNVCVIFTTPNVRFIDINLRESMNAFVKPNYIIEDKNINVCTYKRVYVNDGGEVCKGDFVFYDGKSGAGGQLIDRMYVPRPNPEIEKLYESLSFAMKDEKMKELDEILNGENVTKTDISTLQRKADGFVRLVQHIKESHTWGEISKITGVSDRQIRRWIDAE